MMMANQQDPDVMSRDVMLLELKLQTCCRWKEKEDRSEEVVQLFNKHSDTILNHAELQRNGIYFIKAHLNHWAIASFGFTTEEAKASMMDMLKDDQLKRILNGILAMVQDDPELTIKRLIVYEGYTGEHASNIQKATTIIKQRRREAAKSGLANGNGQPEFPIYRVTAFNAGLHDKSLPYPIEGGHDPDAVLLNKLLEEQPDLLTNRPQILETGAEFLFAGEDSRGMLLFFYTPTTSSEREMRMLQTHNELIHICREILDEMPKEKQHVIRHTVCDTYELFDEEERKNLLMIEAVRIITRVKKEKGSSIKVGDFSNDEWEAKIKATRHNWEKYVRVEESMLQEMFAGGVFGRSCIKANMNVPETERCKDLVERVLHAESKEIMPVTKPRMACIVFIEALKRNHADIVYEIHNHPIPIQSTGRTGAINR